MMYQANNRNAGMNIRIIFRINRFISKLEINKLYILTRLPHVNQYQE